MSLRVTLFICMGVMALFLWLSSGTMVPYAVTTTNPVSIGECNYLGNPDHAHFEAIYRFLQSDAKNGWTDNLLLRRILLPLISYPFFKKFGFMTGGFIANLLTLLLSVVLFYRFMRTRLDESELKYVLMMLATYPGIYYWSSLPYSYAFIVPGCLLGYTLLTKIGESENIIKIAASSLAMGILFLGYDLFPFFLTAVASILLRKKYYLKIPMSVVLMLVPMFVWNYLILKLYYHVEIVNENSGVYGMILKSYLHLSNIKEWMLLIFKSPFEFLRVYLFSSFVFIPILFGYVLVKISYEKISLIDRAFLFCALILFLFNHWAPAYEGWQMRGGYLARLYQPVFLSFIIIIAKFTSANARNVRKIQFVCAMNALVVLGIWVHSPLSSQVYLNFYRHSNRDPNNLWMNLEKYGKRPLGICKHD